MANQWGIPADVEKLVLSRDKKCVYSGVDFSINHVSRKTKPSWEHIINDIHLSSVENIALCCISCNASKSAHKLEEWLTGKYCLSKSINENTVAEVVQNVIRKNISKT
ncbi:HNH endonuclease [Leeuwenhoekiella sp. W20_SRS_FM14]|uniref:HNH endonuclease n=1 Tax=Leeuwenhoekiella sp. W20_SRS_FM14 TaxID=3240270 RepID=UPI003F9BEA69